MLFLLRNFSRLRLIFLEIEPIIVPSRSINFSITKVGFKRSSSISLWLVWTFLVSFFTFAKPPWSSSWVNSGLLVMSATFCEIMSRCSLVSVSWDLINSLSFSWWSSNSSLTIFFIVSSKSSMFSSIVGVIVRLLELLVVGWFGCRGCWLLGYVFWGFIGI